MSMEFDLFDFPTQFVFRTNPIQISQKRSFEETFGTPAVTQDWVSAVIRETMKPRFILSASCAHSLSKIYIYILNTIKD